MRQKPQWGVFPEQRKQSHGEKVVKDIRRATRKQYSAEEKIRIVLDGLKGEDSIAELCRREGIAQSLVLQLVQGIPRGWEETSGGRYGARGDIDRSQRSAA